MLLSKVASASKLLGHMAFSLATANLTFNRLPPCTLQMCEEYTGSGRAITLSIADQQYGEKMYVDADGTPYLYYEGFQSRYGDHYCCIIL